MFSRHIYLLMIVAVLLVPFVGAASAQACASGVNHNEAGTAAFEAGDFQEAIDAFTCAIDANPNDYAAYLARGSAFVLLDDAGHAAADFTVVLSGDPDMLDDAYTLYGNLTDTYPDALEPLILHSYIAWLTSQDEDAIADFDRILTLEPDNIYALTYRGSANLYLGNAEDAAADFDRALELRPDDVSVILTIGDAYLGTGDYQSALPYYDQAIEQMPDAPYPYIRRGQINGQLGNTEEAEEDFNRGIELGSNDPTFYSDRGWFYIQQNRWDDALGDFDQAIGLGLADATIYLGHGAANAGLGDMQAAAQDYMQYIALSNTHSMGGERLGLGESSTVQMMEGAVYEFQFKGDPNQTLRLRATSRDGAVDPLIVVLGPDGTPLAANDDIDTIGNFNSEVTFSAPSTGTYTLVVTHAGAGSTGDLEVSVDAEN